MDAFSNLPATLGLWNTRLAWMGKQIQVVPTFLINIGAHMDILIIIKLKILVPLSSEIGPLPPPLHPQIMVTTHPKIVQCVLDTCVFGVHSGSQTQSTCYPIYECPIKIGNRIRHAYLHVTRFSTPLCMCLAMIRENRQLVTNGLVEFEI